MVRYQILSRDDIAAISALHKAGHSTRAISDQTGVSVRQVQRYVKRMGELGGNKIPAKKKPPGNTRKTSLRTLRVVHREVERNPRVSARKIREDNIGLLNNVSVRTLSRRIHDDLQYLSYAARPKPVVTVAQQEKRLAFCDRTKDWTIDQWRGVLWSDESRFTVTASSQGRVYRRPGSDPLDPRYTAPAVRFPDSLMVWGCFSYHGVGSLVVLPKNTTMNQGNYLELLCDHLPGSFEKCQASTFMQDGAPCHTAKSVKQWLRDCCVPFFEDWPANSPDLNPIENLWAIIKRELRSHDCSTVAKLQAALQYLWNTFTPQHLMVLADSLPARLEECRRRQGKPTKY